MWFPPMVLTPAGYAALRHWAPPAAGSDDLTANMEAQCLKCPGHPTPPGASLKSSPPPRHLQRNIIDAMALHFLYYNFVRIHQTLKVSPAMAAGIPNRLWEMKDVVEMLEVFEASQKRAA